MSYKAIVTTLIVIAAAVGLFFIFKDPAVPHTPLRNGPIVAFGDSLIYGYGSTGGGFVSILSQQINRPIVNMGINGNTTQDGLNRIDAVLAKKPSVVLVLLGGNDFLRKVPEEQTFTNLGAIIEKLQADGVAVVLLGVQGGVFTDPYKSKFEGLADKYDVAYVPNVLDGLIGNKELMYDQIHPNDAGYKKLADKVFPTLNAVLK